MRFHKSASYGKLASGASPLVDEVLRLSKNAAPDVFALPNHQKEAVAAKIEELSLWLAVVLQKVGAEVRQAVLEELVDRLEIALREASVGDVGVAKRVPTFMAAIHGRLLRYGPLLEAQNWPGLATALAEHHLPPTRVAMVKAHGGQR